MTKRRLSAFSLIGIAAVGLAAGVILLTQALSNQSAGILTPVSDVSASSRACLLEAPAGSPAAQQALQGLNDAAQDRKHILVQHFTVPANVSPASVLAELTALHCVTIVTVGSKAEAQVAAHARTDNGTRYLVIGTALPRIPDVTVIPLASATPASVESAVLHITSS